MKLIHRSTAVAAALFVLPAAMLTGCGNEGADPAKTETVATDQHDHAEGGHSLHGWWCVEHGVPEDVCTRCSPKLAAAFQEKGDWCEEHNLPESQCFKCHPELEAKFAAQYEAKFGEKPPKPTK